jgi:LysM repeat protein
MNKIKHIVIVTLVMLAILAAPLTSPVKVAVAQDCAVRHTVAAGETLSSIALKYDVEWTAIATANSLKEPYAIFVGQVLCIPASATTTTTTGTTTTSTTKKPTFTVSVAGTRLYVETSNFTKKAVYFVKIGSGPARVAEYVKLGRLLVRKDTTATASYRIIKKYQDASILTVCLKNVRSDELQCKTIFNPNAP